MAELCGTLTLPVGVRTPDGLWVEVGDIQIPLTARDNGDGTADIAMVRTVEEIGADVDAVLDRPETVRTVVEHITAAYPGGER